MKLFKKIQEATVEDTKQYQYIEIIKRLANSVVIDTDDRLIVVKHEFNDDVDITSMEFYSLMCDKLFVTIESDKKLSSDDLLALFNKNVRILGNDNIQGIRIFQSRMLN